MLPPGEEGSVLFCFLAGFWLEIATRSAGEPRKTRYCLFIPIPYSPLPPRDAIMGFAFDNLIHVVEAKADS